MLLYDQRSIMDTTECFQFRISSKQKKRRAEGKEDEEDTWQCTLPNY